MLSNKKVDDLYIAYVTVVDIDTHLDINVLYHYLAKSCDVKIYYQQVKVGSFQYFIA